MGVYGVGQTSIFLDGGCLLTFLRYFGQEAGRKATLLLNNTADHESRSCNAIAAQICVYNIIEVRAIPLKCCFFPLIFCLLWLSLL